LNEWIDELSDLTAAGNQVVLVTVARIRGSAPREAGARMIVTATESIGTIGGGQLEHQCVHIAAGLLGGDEKPVLRNFPLGPALGQCCGGVVDVLFEPIASGLPGWLRDLRAVYGQRQPAVLVTDTGVGGAFVVTGNTVYGPDPGELAAATIKRARAALDSGGTHLDDAVLYAAVVGSEFNIAVFGAGHVGAAVVRTLSALDCNIRWIDSRRNIFRAAPANVRMIETEAPALEVAAMPPASCYLVMTHSHPLDLEICERILRRGDAAYCGLIGSLTKRRRFEKRLRAYGLTQSALDTLVCPIGVEGITGKRPAEIAIAASADLLRAYEASLATAHDLPGNVQPIRG
jgi:xanthine dehydrogenase accessory factor